MSTTRHYENFDLLVSAGSPAMYEVRVLTTSTGATTAAPVAAPADELAAWEADIAAWRGLRLDRSGVRRLGTGLLAWLLRGPVLPLYRASMAAAQSASGCRIRLHIEPPELHAIPWETCYDPDTASFPAQDPRTPLVRYLLGTFSRGQLTGARLKVLIVIASPAGLPQLETAEEYDHIRNALAALAGQVEIMAPVSSLPELQDALRRGPDVLHFIGHGGFDAERGGYLVLDDGQGGPQPVDAEVLAGSLRGSRVRLAVLNACESAATDPADSFAGVAPRLVQAGLPAVIAMHTFLPDAVAAVFSGALYRGLADGWPVDAALTAGRQALFGHAPESVFWSIPVLYLSAADGVLWQPAAEPKPAPAGPPPSPTSTFQFNFAGPTTIHADVVGGNKYVTSGPDEEADTA